MTSDSAQQPALATEEDPEHRNAAVLGFTQVDGVWTHPKYKPELVQVVMEFLKNSKVLSLLVAACCCLSAEQRLTTLSAAQY